MKTKTIPNYQDGLNELVTQLEGMLPAAALETFDKDASALQARHTSPLKLQAGQQAPDFQLPNALGKSIQLSEVVQQGPVVLVFYRGTWCPYCNLQLAQYQAILEDIKNLGANLIAVSPQNADQSISIKEKNNLQYEVLTDLGAEIAEQFVQVFKNDDTPVEVMAELGIDYDSFYDDDARKIPVPAVFIINSDRSIRFAKSLGGDYRNRVEPQEILKALA